MERTWKRHAEQFTAGECDLAEGIRRDIIENGEKRIADHCQEAMDESGASVYDLADSLRQGLIIEVSRKNGSFRIATRLERAGTAHCAVFSQDGTAVTYWVNRAGDNHRTLDLGKYSLRAFA